LYRLVENNSRTKGKVKIIGIGIGNSPYEVGFFRKKYQIPFPLFSDGAYIIHKRIGEVRTPYFIGVRIDADGTHRVIYSKPGGFKDPEKFFRLMVQQAGL